MDIKSWAVGFIEGDGCLAISNRTRAKTSPKHYYYPLLTIQIRADDPNIIPQIERVIGVKAYVAIRRPSQRTWNTKTTIQATWKTKEALKAIINLIDAHPLVGKKANEYVYWRKAASIYTSETTDCNERNKRILELKELITELRVYKEENTIQKEV